MAHQDKEEPDYTGTSLEQTTTKEHFNKYQLSSSGSGWVSMIK